VLSILPYFESLESRPYLHNVFLLLGLPRGLFTVRLSDSISNNFSLPDYGLDDRMIVFRIPAGAGSFSLRHRVQTGSGACPTSYPMDTGGSFPGGKAAGA